MTSFAIRQRVFVMFLAALALLWGTTTFLTMPRREDPELRIRTAQVTCMWPGAPAEKVDELVSDVLEGAIEEVDDVDEIVSTSRVGVSIVSVTLDKRLKEFEQVWDEIRNELRAIEQELPEGATAPIVNSNFGDVSSLCLVMHQVPPPGETAIDYVYTDRELDEYAELLERELEAIASIGSVTAYGLLEERISLEVRSADWAKLGITVDDLRSALDDRNIVVASGQLETPGGRFVLRASGELDSVSEIEDVVVGTREGGEPILLGDLAVRVRRTVEDPANERVRFASPEHRSPRAVLLGIEMRGGANVVEMGLEVDEALARLRSTRLPPDLDFAVVNDLPRQVDELVRDFVNNLWQAVAIVLLVALLMMGWRPAVVMALAVPLCMVSALGVVRLFDVELEQFSIASLIISLGMIVDNAIVVSDQTMALLKSGMSKLEAAREGARSLATPILASTFTTVAAFLPLVTIPGESGEYIRSLPIVVSTTLLASYVVAMVVTPILCLWLLRPPAKQTEEEPPGRVARAYSRLIRRCLSAQPLVLLLAVLAVAGSLGLVPHIGNQFFPGGIRDQFFVHVRLPHGSSLDDTTAMCARVEDLILETAETTIDGERVQRLENAFSIVGNGGPRLMLTMQPENPSPRYAHIIVNTTDKAYSKQWAAELRAKASTLPGARIDLRNYVLGPPVEFPVEFRLSGADGVVLRRTADEMVSVLRDVPGITDPYHDWGTSSYRVEVRIDDRKAELAGLSNRDIANSVNDLVAGRTLTNYRDGDRSIPVVLRLPLEERSTLAALDELYVGGRDAKVPLDTVADVVTSWQPAQVGRVDRMRAVTIGSQVGEEFLSTQVSAAALPRMQEIAAALPAGYTLEERGEKKESADGQADIGNALMIGMLLVLVVLVSQYNSLAKPFVVLSAIPLALIGALLGLFVTGWPLGFMPSLGIVSLAGVVINNAIILIDFIQNRVAAGVELRDAVEQAGHARMKPIVLTTLTTVGGLFPWRSSAARCGPECRTR